MECLEYMEPHVVDPVWFARDVLGWQPDAGQWEVLRSPRKRVILNWGRQSGKTTVAAAKIAHTAATMPGTTSVWVSAVAEHTAEVFAKLRGYFSAMETPVKGQRGMRLAIVLPNGSRILGLAARDATVRSYTAHLLVIDEAAQVKNPVYDAITAQLARNVGTMWVLGTPRGKEGRFWEIWERGDEREWFKSQRKTVDCGRIPADFLESERRIKSEAVMKREYEAQFVGDGEQLLQDEAVESIFQKTWRLEDRYE